MKTTEKERYLVMNRLSNVGIDYDTAKALRRIAMTLSNWYELECGTDGPNNSTWSIERDEVSDKPFRRVQYQSSTQGWIDNRFPIADREKGALKRLKALMAPFTKLMFYVQTDPRGASLFILKKSDVVGHNIDSVYNRGVAVY